jgi:transposase
MQDRRIYSKEFKLMAIELMNSGKSSVEVGRELDIASDLVRRWRREYIKFHEGSFSGKGVPNLTDEQKEIARLKKALADALLDAEILKKAVSIFSTKDRTNSNL